MSTDLISRMRVVVNNDEAITALQAQAATQASVGQSAKTVAADVEKMAPAIDKVEVAAKKGAGGVGAMSGAFNLAKTAVAGFVGGLAAGLIPAVALTAMAAFTDLMTKQRREAEALKEQHKKTADAIADAVELLRGGGSVLQAWNRDTAAATGLTGSLTDATRSLADQTFRLADARRQAAVAKLNEQSATLRQQARDLEGGGAGLAGRAAIALSEKFGLGFTDQQIEIGGVNADGTPMTAAGSREQARQQKLDQAASLDAMAMMIAMAPPSKDPKPAETGGAGKSVVAKANDETAEFLKRARELTTAANLDTAALLRRSAAIAAGGEALEELAVTEAGLGALRRLGITDLDKLTASQRAEALQAKASAEARERQAIATEKAEKVAATSADIDKRIASERAHAVAIAAGTAASIEYARAEFVRNEVERAGKNLTADQVAELTRKAELLFQVQAATDQAAADAQLTEELRLLQMTNRERALEEEFIRQRNLLLAQGIETIEAEARARAGAIAVQGAYENAAAIGQLRDSIREGFIESGSLGMDKVADYAKRRLREAVYDAFLARPIDIIVNATVNSIGGQLGNLLSGGAAAGGAGANGLLGALLGKQMLGGTLGGILGAGGLGVAAGQSMGLGSGNGALDLIGGLGGAALGTAFAAPIATAVGSGIMGIAGGLGATASGAVMAGGMGATAMMSLAGPLAAIAALAVLTLAKDNEGERPQAFSTIGVQNGQFTRTGTRAGDNGPVDDINKIADTVATSLNGLAETFGLDLEKLAGFYTSVGVVQGKDSERLGQGYYGGQVNGAATGDANSLYDQSFEAGVGFSNMTDAGQLAEEVVRDTILRAIAAGASDLSEAEQTVVRQAASLEEAALKISAGRSLAETLDQALQQLLDPAAFERDQALAAVEANYKALKTQAEELIAAGLVTTDALKQIDTLHAAELDAALVKLSEAAGQAGKTLNFSGTIKDKIAALTDPDAYARNSALGKIDREYQANVSGANILIAAGQATAELLTDIETLRDLQVADALANLAGSTDDLADANDNLKNSADQTARAWESAREGMRRWLDQVGSSEASGLNPAGQAAAALAAYERIKAAAQGGDLNAAGSLTAYADRALATDREATSSAEQRRALFERITGEVSGIAGSGFTGNPANDNAALVVQLQSLTTALGGEFGADAAQTVRPVSLANLPDFSAAYATVATPQTDRLVTSISTMKADLGKVLDQIKADENVHADELQTTLIEGFTTLETVFTEAIEGMKRLADEQAKQRAAQEVANQLEAIRLSLMTGVKAA